MEGYRGGGEGVPEVGGGGPQGEGGPVVGCGGNEAGLVWVDVVTEELEGSGWRG